MADEPANPPSFTGDFRVGDWLVQPSLDRLSRGNMVAHLRPQLTNLLLLLARHGGRTVSKELILKEVWSTQYVGESVLTRCITELRQALHDDARAPRVIETIPKRGYRLLAPVEFVEDAQADPGNGTGHGRVEVPAPSVEDSFTGGLATEGASGERTDRAPEAALPSSTSRFMGARARWTALKVAIVVGVAVTVGAGDWSGRAVISERDTVLLADVANSTGNRVFDDTLRLALAVNLEQAPFLRVLPQAGVRAALVRMGRSPDDRVVGPLALDVCRREGAAVLLAGSIAPLGSRYAVGIEALACATGDSLGRALGEAPDREHVLGVLEQMASRIRLKLGESRTSLRQHSIPLVRATTASFEALEALTLGDDNRDHARVGDALDLYRQATELDPGFALAWARRGAAASTLENREEALSAFRRAYDLREKVSQPERFYIEAHYYRFVMGDPQKAIDAYRAWKRMYPGSLVPPTNLASILTGSTGQYDAALVEAREAVRLGPYSSIAYGALVRACLGSGRIAEAREAIAAATRQGISDTVIHHYMLNLALFDGDRTAIEREVRWASGDAAAALQTWQLRASAAMADGRVREARGLWAEAITRAREIGPAARVAQVRLSWAASEALVGDARLARTNADTALAEDRCATTMVDAAIVFALVGDSARAQSLLDNVSRQPAVEPAATLVWIPIARALLDSRVAQSERGLAILAPVVRFERGSDFGPAPLVVRGLVNLSAHRPTEAAAAFDEVGRLRALHPASPWLPFARLALARALRQSGDTARSLAAYDDFLTSWKGADGDAPLLKVAQRERAAMASR